MNWRPLCAPADKVRSLIYIVMALFFVGLGLHIWRKVHGQLDLDIERATQAVYPSPSGLWTLSLVEVRQQIFLMMISWREIELRSPREFEEPIVVLKWEGGFYGVEWADEKTAKITVANSAVIAKRLRDVDGVRVEVFYEPDDPVERRNELLSRKTPVDQWHLYDIKPD